MKRKVVVGVAALFLVAVSSGAEEAPARVADLAFLAGTWERQTGAGTFTSHYTTPEGGKVLSYSELVRGGQVAFHEFERFDVRGGVLVLAPFPGGKPAVPLTLSHIDVGERKAVFENPEKDFPTRIVYHRAEPDRLVITLTDPHHDDDRVDVFDLSRVEPGDDAGS